MAKSSQAKWILRNQITLCLITCQLCMISCHSHHHTGRLLLIAVCLFIRLFTRYVIITLLNLHLPVGHGIMHQFPKRYDPRHPSKSLNSAFSTTFCSLKANARLAKRGGRTMAITPRHYLDFINHYANLFNEKRSELEEQQMHLNVGLRKIKETVDQVCVFKTLPSVKLE